MAFKLIIGKMLLIFTYRCFMETFQMKESFLGVHGGMDEASTDLGHDAASLGVFRRF
jgi:hypothetical protein